MEKPVVDYREQKNKATKSKLNELDNKIIQNQSDLVKKIDLVLKGEDLNKLIPRFAV